MEINSRHVRTRARVADASEQFADATARASKSMNEKTENAKTTAHDISDLTAEYFDAINFDPKDLLQIPSIVTMLGLIATAVAVKDLESVEGLIWLTAAFVADLVDGGLARLLDQSSDAGKLFDASADKMKILMVVIAAWKQGTIPREFLVAVGLIESSHVAMTGIAKLRNKNASLSAHPIAKRGMTVRVVAGALFSAAAVAKLDDRPMLASKLFNVAVGAGAAAIAIEIPTAKIFYNRMRPGAVVTEND